MKPHRLDRPAVAVILSAALAVGALLGVYASHVAPRTAPASTSSAGQSWSRPVCHTVTRNGATPRPCPRRWGPVVIFRMPQTGPVA